MRRMSIAATGLALFFATVTVLGQPSELDRTIQSAYQAAYDLDNDAGLALARRAVALAPDSSRAHRTLAALLWIQILFDRGAATIDQYLGNITRGQRSLPKPPVALDEEFKAE